MMTLLKRISLMTMALGIVLVAPQTAAADEDDPPARAARLGYTRGSVSFEPAGTDEWVSAVMNRPITTGDKLWTDRDARAELHIGSAAIRLGSETGFSFLNLNDNTVQISLSEGVIGIHLRRLDQDETVEVDTPNLAFSLLRPGDYRLEVNEAGDTTVVSVRAGEGEVTGGGQAFTVHSGQHATFMGTDQLTSDLDRLDDYDDFDRWCRDRTNHEEHTASARYVSPDVVGYEDLDDYGQWRTVPDYGPIWVPGAVDAGWAPYRYGHWVWISPWGWTWVDDAPWGFAPFHYGRWVYVGRTWGWCPGPVRAVRPVYSPALVAWVGGPHFSISIGVGRGGPGVAWFPLGPREVYIPPYRVSRAYVTNVNVTNTTVNNTYVTNVYNNYTTNNNVTNIKYVNRTAPGAVTATSQTAFSSGQPIHRNIVRMDERQIAQSQVTNNVGVVPQQRSVFGAAAAARVRPSAAAQTRAVVAKTQPPPAPVSFAKQQQTIQSNGGRPLGRQEVQRLESTRAQAPAPVRVMRPAAKPVPVESVARTRPSQTQQQNRAVPRTTSGVNQSTQPAPAPQQSPQIRQDSPAASQPNRPSQQAPPPQQGPRIREDRPPSAQPNGTQRPASAVPNHSEQRAAQSPRTIELERRQQQEQEKLQQQQEQAQKKLEQKHQQQEQRIQQQAENQRQQQEHQKLQQKQEQDRQKLDQRQRQQQEKVQKQETKQGPKQKQGQDHP